MKKFLLSLVFAAGFAGSASAQAKPAGATKSKTEIKTVDKMPSANASPVPGDGSDGDGSDGDGSDGDDDGDDGGSAEA